MYYFALWSVALKKKKFVYKQTSKQKLRKIDEWNIISKLTSINHGLKKCVQYKSGMDFCFCVIKPIVYLNFWTSYSGSQLWFGVTHFVWSTASDSTTYTLSSHVIQTVESLDTHMRSRPCVSVSPRWCRKAEAF